MTTNLRASWTLKVDAQLTTTLADNTRQERYKSGTPLLPSLDSDYTDGSTANKVNKHYHRAHTITASGSVTIDLSAATMEDGSTVALTKVKWVLIRLRSPAASVKVVVGNAASDPWAPWASSATVTEDVADKLLRENSVDGWTVATPKNLKIANPGASSVIVDVSIGGS